MPKKSTKLSLWESPSLATRVSAKTVRAQKSIETKGEPIFPRGGQQWYASDGRAMNIQFAGSAINYASDVGPLWHSSLVMAPVNFIGVLLTEAPPQVVEYNKKDEAEAVKDHALTKLLNTPNPWTTGDAMMMAFALDWLINGNVYWMKERDPSNYHQVVRLWPLPAFLVQPRWENEPGSFITKYRYTVNGQRTDYIPEDIVHFKRGSDPNNVRLGLGAFQPVLREIYADNMAANFSAVALKNWGVLPFVLSPKKGVAVDDNSDPFEGLTPEQIKEKAEAIKQSFVSGTTGDNRGLPIVQTIPLDVTKIGFNPKELDISELTLSKEARVAAVTGIPAQVLGYLVGLVHGTNRATYEQAVQQAYYMVIKPMMKIVEATIMSNLLPEFGSAKGAKQEFRFDFSKVQALQEDRDKIYSRGIRALSAGGITLNMFRASIDKPLEDVDVIFTPRTSLPMTMETFAQIAADPTALQGAMPAERALAGQPTTLDGGAPAKNARHNGNGFHVGNGHHPPPRQIEGIKSVEYDGMTLWREPTPLEQTINLKAIQDAFDSGEKKIEKELLDLREKLIDAAIAGIIILSPSDYHTLTLQAPEKSVEQLRNELQAIYDHGRQLVLDELAAQGATNLGEAGSADEIDAADLDTLAGLSASRLMNDLQSRVVGLAAGLAALGITGSDLETRLQEEIDAASLGYVHTNALEADHVALAAGRFAEGSDFTDEGLIDHVIYSSVLDRNTDAICEETDGETGSIDSVTPVPNENCLGGALCRCVWIFVFNEEAKGARRRNRNRRARSTSPAQAGPLTVQEQTSLVAYQSDGYRINKALRDSDVEVPETALLDSAIAKSEVPEDILVYHGLGEVLPRNLELLKTIGAEISDAGYLSCSVSLNKARLLSTSGHETVLAIKMSKGAPGYQSKDELILERELALRVVGSSKEGDTNIIRMIAVKYSDDQARDDHGRWTSEGGGASVTSNEGASGGTLSYGTPSAKDFIAARASTTRPGFLSPLKPGDLADHELFLSEDGKTGFAIDKNGDVQNLFNNGGEPGAGRKALFDAVDKGGRTLDAFDGHLSEMYSQAGFVETGRMVFSSEHAPTGWDYKNYGKPDVVFMAWKGWPDNNRTTSLERTLGPRSKWNIPTRGEKYYDDYDKAKADARRGAVS